jgi:hypothetical protein
MVFKLWCSQKFNETYCICLQPPSLLRATATQVIVSMLAIFTAGILLSVQPFSISWKLLYWTRWCFVQNVFVSHTTTLLSIWKTNLVNCRVCLESLSTHRIRWCIESLCWCRHHCDCTLPPLVPMQFNFHWKSWVSLMAYTKTLQDDECWWQEWYCVCKITHGDFFPLITT